MTAAVLEFVVLAAIIVVAGSVLTRCADAIAEITGWGRLLVGSLLLAGATSLPELTVVLSAVRLNIPDIAVGNLLGANLMNLLILAVMDLSHHSRGKMLSRAAVAHAFSGMLGISLAAVVGIGILVAPRTAGFTLFNMHASVWVLGIGYLLGVRMVFLDQRVAVRNVITIDDDDEKPPMQQRSLGRYAAIFVVAAATIIFVGPRLAEVAGRIAELSGLAESFVGTTFVALSTTLPELVVSITAIRLGAIDLIIGNVFGSNAFNMLLFVPLELSYSGPVFAVTNSAHVISVLTFIVGTSIVIMGQLYQRESRVRFLEPDAWLVISLVAVAMLLVYATA